MNEVPQDIARRLALRAGAGLAATAFVSACATNSVTEPNVGAAAVIDAFYSAYEAQDIETMLALFPETFHFEDPTFHLKASNKDELRAIVASLREFRNIRFARFNTFHAGPWVATQAHVRAEAAGPDQNGRHRQIDVQGAAIFEVQGGRIVRWYDYFDVLSFRQQTGHA